METKTLFIDLFNSKDCIKGEKDKTRLENLGYNLVKESCTYTQARLYYVLDEV